MNNYKELIVRQKSMLLVELVYKQTDSFPNEEIHSGPISLILNLNTWKKIEGRR
ncbi:hypothetical protein [uncultured Kriegella sp.]|uniref:hypothetical protein n=1 Tax=uncultured Kriegella sp. TaxID=1798910 RepID=UPI0030DD513E